VLNADEDGGHSLDTIINLTSLRNTCTDFKMIIDSSRLFQLDTIKIKNVKNDQVQARGNLLKQLQNNFVKKRLKFRIN